MQEYLSVHMEYPTKIMVFLVSLSVGVNLVIVTIWAYYYNYYPSLLTPDTHVLMAWLLATTAIGMVGVSVELYGFLYKGMRSSQ
ncbi:MAG: hypothetical protein WB661_01290 [Candidatus Bathyarchaeia archaeon]